MRRRAESGEINFVAVLMLCGVALAGYFAYALMPAFSDEMDVSQQIHAIANDGWRRIGKDELHKRVLEAMGKIGHHVETPAGGQPTDVPGLEVEDDDVEITCTDQDQDCSDAAGDVTIAVHYTRQVPLPGLQGKFVTLHFNPSAQASLQPVKW